MYFLNNIWINMMVLSLLLSACSQKPSAGTQVLITDSLPNKVIDSYWLYLPRNYDQHKAWPVILFLTGSAGASPDPKTSKEDGPAKYALINVEQEGAFQLVSDSFLIINPHMRAGPEEKRQWYQYPEILNQILDHVIKEFSGDPSRIYITGLSMGGHGSWGLAKKLPEKFAAIVPIAGRISCNNGCEELANIPMWIIHNTGDQNVAFDYSHKTVAYFEDELERSFLKISEVTLTPDQFNSNLIFSALENEGHDAWSEAYRSSMLYEWLLSQHQ